MHALQARGEADRFVCPLARGLSGVGQSNVYLRDSGLMTLCARLLGRVHHSTGREAAKLHFRLSNSQPMDFYLSIGTLSVNPGAYRLMPQHGSVVVADRGYCDTERPRNWVSMGICFIVRLKKKLKDRRLVE